MGIRISLEIGQNSNEFFNGTMGTFQKVVLAPSLWYLDVEVNAEA
jgi:hypothetical protein